MRLGRRYTDIVEVGFLMVTRYRLSWDLSFVIFNSLSLVLSPFRSIDLFVPYPEFLNQEIAIIIK